MEPSRRARDEWLALRCQASENGAFESLIAEFERPLFYYAGKLTGDQEAALDVLQEVWIRALRGIHKLEDPGSVRSWLYTLVHGVAVDAIRRDRTRDRAEQTHAESSEDSTGGRFTALDAAAVHQCLDRLEWLHRELLVLYFIEDFSLKEMSRILGVPEGTVKSRLHHAKRALKKALEGKLNAN